MCGGIWKLLFVCFFLISQFPVTEKITMFFFFCLILLLVILVLMYSGASAPLIWLTYWPMKRGHVIMFIEVGFHRKLKGRTKFIHSGYSKDFWMYSGVWSLLRVEGSLHI